MELSIIIINYRSAGYIIQALQSAFAFASAGSFEWIVVDNDSKDNSKALILQQFPGVKWIDMGYNAGFARANNEGIRQSTGSSVLLLNPDTIVLDDAIARCYGRFRHSAYVACSVQLLFADRSPQISGNYFMKGGLNHLLPIPYWGVFLKQVAGVLQTPKPNVLQASAEERVDWINGAFLMVKKTVIAVAGLMDEDFFLYAEETEWCSRLMKVGQLCIYGDIYLIHLQGETIEKATGSKSKGYTGLSDKKGLQLMVSNHLRIRKQYGVNWFLFQLLNFTLAIPVFFICSIVDNLLHAKNPLARWNEIKGFSGNVAKLWKVSPRIIRNRPYFYKFI